MIVAVEMSYFIIHYLLQTSISARECNFFQKYTEHQKRYLIITNVGILAKLTVFICSVRFGY